jgi:energy-coupling factor transporter ATP-binding protein EcfA2
VSTLEIRDLQVSVKLPEGELKPILAGVDLTVKAGETHAIMGPNGSGKSTLAYSIAGHPKYQITGGSVTLDGADVLAMTVDERARAGLFLAMQYPVEVPGVSVANFLRTAKTVEDPLAAGREEGFHVGEMAPQRPQRDTGQLGDAVGGGAQVAGADQVEVRVDDRIPGAFGPRRPAVDPCRLAVDPRCAAVDPCRLAVDPRCAAGGRRVGRPRLRVGAVHPGGTGHEALR